MVISFFSPLTSTNLSLQFYLLHPNHTPRATRTRPSRTFFSARSPAVKNALISSSINRNPPRSLFPGVYKRAECES
ncbi:hypothetical protein CASFOL_010544 [Castilleja foliolosa]|uniref:Uncharacterized protein n=1 Tax=Castilleja foliolosa TaxID=1961234 RepID=A0ABD3DWQ9_9LAMI